MTAETGPKPFATASLIIGSVALVLALVTIFAGPFSPQPEAGQSLGEVAGDAMRAAARRAAGLDAEAAPTVSRPWDLDRMLQVAIAVGGGVALILAIVSFIQHEPRRAATAAGGLAAAAIAIPFVWQMAMAILAVLVIVAIIGALTGGAGI